ncbi:PAM68 family protein [Synechococcus sp. ATX 2A4]|uniref:PAM68 family protein n=1 Tax=Synechococcus sp. ATX 2A4 TaxID=2823727 RepID=UPI0020CEDB00|nr:PAM68 family protein [Synechococcus sp. ATX 2A4]MCP9886287.1 PAM68 family protein [Synechococcus sp. ATX 2A4]
MAAKRKPRPKASGLAPSATAGTGKPAKASGAKVIPRAVANRMARRIALATGVPSFLGMAAFVVSYLLVSRNIYDVPPVLTLAVSGGLFLLGVLGLSYGVLSASWEDAAGSLLGLEQIGLNISRVRASIRAMRQGSKAPG